MYVHTYRRPFRHPAPVSVSATDSEKAPKSLQAGLRCKRAVQRNSNGMTVAMHATAYDFIPASGTDYTWLKAALPNLALTA